MRLRAGTLGLVLLACSAGVPVEGSPTPPAQNSYTPPPSTPYVPEPEPDPRPSTSSSSGDPSPPTPKVPCTFASTDKYGGAPVRSAHISTCQDGGVHTLIANGLGHARVISEVNAFPQPNAFAVQSYDPATSTPDAGFAVMSETQRVALAGDALHTFVFDEKWQAAELNASGATKTSMGTVPSKEGETFAPKMALSTSKGMFVFSTYTESFTSNTESLVATRSGEGAWTFTRTSLMGSLDGVLGATPTGAGVIAYSLLRDKTADVYSALPGGAATKLYEQPDAYGITGAVFDTETGTSGVYAGGTEWPSTRLAIFSGGAVTFKKLGAIDVPCTYASGDPTVCGSMCTESGVLAGVPVLVSNGISTYALWMTQTVSRNQLVQHGCVIGPIGCGCYPQVTTSTYGPLIVHVAARAGTDFTEKWSHTIDGLAVIGTDSPNYASLHAGFADTKLHVLVQPSSNANAAWLVLDPP